MAATAGDGIQIKKAPAMTGARIMSKTNYLFDQGAIPIRLGRGLDTGEGRVQLRVAMPCTTAMIATEMPAAMRPYSTAVAPDSSFTKRFTRFVIVSSIDPHVAV